MRLFLFLTVLLYSAGAAAADLDVQFQGISPQKGKILVGLYDSEETLDRGRITLWENGGLIADRGPLGAWITVDAATVTASFRDLEPGRYAILAVHDFNSNGRLDRFFGIPMEPFAFYQATPPVNIPTFNSTSVNLTGSQRTIVIAFGSDAPQ